MTWLEWLSGCDGDIPALVVLILVLLWIGTSRIQHKKKVDRLEKKIEQNNT